MVTREDTSVDRPVGTGRLAAVRAWPYTFAVVLSAVVLVVTLGSAQYLNLPLRDPEGFLGPAYVRLPVMGISFIAGGIFLQALWRARSWRVWPEAVAIVKYEWTWRRLAYIATGLIIFYICYVCYRNLKSFLPFVRSDTIDDHWLFRVDYFLMFNHPPERILHGLLGTDYAAHVLAFVYVSYLIVVPASLAAMLVWNRDLSRGAWYSTALCLNWILGVCSYYIFPSLGPAFSEPQRYADLAETSVTNLQSSLFTARIDVLEDPWGTEKIHGIAGFASLHTSVVFMVCLFLVRVGIHRYVRWFAWVYFALTITATLYFGWHFIADDIAGMFIGWLSVYIGALVTGNSAVSARNRKREAALQEA